MTMTREQAEKEHLKWLRSYYGSLRGFKCVSVSVKMEDDGYGMPEPWPRLTFENARGERLVIEVSRDEEGNGPGFLFGLPLPQSKGA